MDQDGETEVARYLTAGGMTHGGRVLGVATQGKYGTAEASFTASLLPPLNGYEYSSASTAYNLGDTGTHEVGHFLGLSWNPDGSQAATLWFCDWVDYVRSASAQQLLADPSAVSEVRSLKSGPGEIFVGQCVDEEDFPFPSAHIFTPAGLWLPEVGDVVLVSATGSETHREPDDATALWHDDDRPLRARTERRGKERVAVVDLRFLTQAPSQNLEDRRRCMWPICGGLMIVARAQTVQAVTGGTINVYTLDPATGEFGLSGSHHLTDSDQTINALTWDCSNHDQIVSSTGEIRIRLELVQEGNGPGALVLDLARLHEVSAECER